MRRKPKLSDVPTSWVLADTRNMDRDHIRSLYRSVAPGLLLSDQLTIGKVLGINEINMAAYFMADGEISIFGRRLQLQAGVRSVTIETDCNLLASRLALIAAWRAPATTGGWA
jgi:hypothetical protein